MLLRMDGKHKNRAATLKRKNFSRLRGKRKLFMADIREATYARDTDRTTVEGRDTKT